jgi:hypothetical protein
MFLLMDKENGSCANVVTRVREDCNEEPIATRVKVCKLLFEKKIRHEATFCHISKRALTTLAQAPKNVRIDTL